MGSEFCFLPPEKIRIAFEVGLGHEKNTKVLCIVQIQIVLELMVSLTLTPSPRHQLRTADPHGRAAYKLLALVPVSCDPPATPMTPRRRPSSAMTPQVAGRLES